MVDKTRFNDQFEYEQARSAEEQAVLDERIDCGDDFLHPYDKGNYTVFEIDRLKERARYDSLAYAELTRLGIEVKE